MQCGCLYMVPNIQEHQISDEAVSRLEETMKIVIARKGSNGCVKAEVGHKVYGTNK